MTAGSSVKLVIPSEVKLVDVVHASAEKMAEVAGFDADDALNIGLAVREAVINAMLHGNQKDPTRLVDVAISLTADALVATVRDHGNGFDPDQTPDPTTGNNLLRSSGRGLLLIRAFVDEVEFELPPGGGTRVKMTKRYSSDDSDQGDS